MAGVGGGGPVGGALGATGGSASTPGGGTPRQRVGSLWAKKKEGPRSLETLLGPQEGHTQPPAVTLGPVVSRITCLLAHLLTYLFDG